MSFGSGNEFNHATAAFVGARFGFDGPVQPNLFAHLGLGFVNNSETGPYGDIGAGIDFQLTRVFSLGIQLAYNSVWDDRSPYGSAKWLSFGLNFGFDLGRRTRERHRRDD